MLAQSRAPMRSARHGTRKNSCLKRFFEHEEVDIISSTVKSMQSYCETKAREEALAEVAAAAHYIEHIQEIDCVRWENVF